jgi:hypothetical protein
VNRLTIAWECGHIAIDDASDGPFVAFRGLHPEPAKAAHPDPLEVP